ncbi:MAG: type II toxin-antitoxin system Phd/YefM family antitoxin [Cellulomonadaceae bacterium]|nr:type II toxin-antitoxin system Phd/YefM family antitoxin [Cellulomonadaceae bacterium]
MSTPGPVTTRTISEARATLPALVDLVHAGGEVTITRHDVPIAVLVSPDALQYRRHSRRWDAADRIERMIDGRWDAPHPGKDGRAVVMNAGTPHDGHGPDVHQDRESREAYLESLWVREAVPA